MRKLLYLDVRIKDATRKNHKHKTARVEVSNQTTFEFA